MPRSNNLNKESIPYPGSTPVEGIYDSKISKIKKNFPNLEKIRKAVEWVFKGFLGVFFYWSNPVLFGTSFFLLGMVWHKQYNKEIAKIAVIWKTQHYLATSLSVLGALVNLPFALAAGSVLYGAYMGSTLLSCSMHRFKNKFTPLDEKHEKLALT